MSSHHSYHEVSQFGVLSCTASTLSIRHGRKKRSKSSTTTSSLINNDVNNDQYDEVLYNDSLYIKQYLNLYYGSIVTFFTIVIYLLSWLLFGTLFLTLALMREDMEPSLRERGFSYLQNGVFLTISAFTNTGLSLSGDSYLYMNTNAGNTNKPLLPCLFILHADDVVVVHLFIFLLRLILSPI